jgi:hypothetical protein
MLTRLVGQSGIERAKTVAVAVFATLWTLALIQAWTSGEDSNRLRQDRQASVEVARQFALALTTYDFAHPDLQLRALSQVSEPGVVRAVATASNDLEAAKAASVGGVLNTVLIASDSSESQILVRTSQVARSDFSDGSSVLTGLLEVTVTNMEAGWKVSAYEWLRVPTFGS